MPPRLPRPQGPPQAEAGAGCPVQVCALWLLPSSRLPLFALLEQGGAAPALPLQGTKGAKVPRPRCPTPAPRCVAWGPLLGADSSTAAGSPSARHGAGGAQALGAAEHPRDRLPPAPVQ